MFKPVKPTVDFPKLEEEVLKLWKKIRAFEKQLELRKNAPKFVFLEGPPTANGLPHPGHVLTRTVKDLVCRFKAMDGYFVPRKAGWDTHGLPVEIEVEKMLGINSKKEIEDFGIEKFNKLCKESVFKYEKAWVDMTERLGFWIDMEHPYITLDNDYIESVWWSLKTLYEKGLLYRGYKIVWYCPRCGTPLSSHEVSLGYKSVKDPSLYVKFKVKGEDNTYFLAWTTTPWTLLSNVALAVHPELDYVLIQQGNDKYILAKELVDEVIEGDYKILKTFKGKELERKEYEPLFKYVELDAPAYYVVLADFVTVEEGTGIVHIAPAYGQEDYEVGKEYGLPILQLVREDGIVKDEAVDFKGLFFKEADKLIIKDLEKRGMLYKKGLYEHDYPFCWRCETPLINYARKAWFIAMSKLKENLLKNNELINWVPENIKYGRFGNFLENVVDWALSRERYWGTPLPIWTCEKCGHIQVIGSRQEIKSMALNDVDLSDLHKPYIDKVKLKCPKCGGTMNRVPDVIDVWYDSGAAPFAQHHYPFEGREKFEEEFPVDFISEAVDQTRGWFYSLLAISTALFNKPAYKNVVVLGLILDKYGRKMSKSKGNVIDPWEFFNRDGADSLRWYLLTNSAPWEPMRFIPEVVSEIRNRFIGTLWNTYTFFVTYANIDNFNPMEFSLPYEKRSELDRWLISRLNSVIQEVRNYLNSYELHKAGRTIEHFVINELSNWYVRRSRRRFWEEELTEDKISAYLTLYEALVTVIKLLAPFVPFITEAIYQNLVRTVDKSAPESIHHTDYPKPNEKMIDKELEERMNLAITVVEAGRAARFLAKIKARQPLYTLYVKFPSKEDQKKVETLLDVIKEELNVKEIKFADDLSEFLEVTVKLNYEKVGPKFKELVKPIERKLSSMQPEEIEKCIMSDGKLKLTLNGQEIILITEDLNIRKSAKEGYSYSSKGKIEVVLDTKIDEPLLLEGLARDVVRRIQEMRKQMDLQYTQQIDVYYDGDPLIEKTINKFIEYIKGETLARSISKGIQSKGLVKEWNIEKLKVKLEIVP
ncbi:MAG: isoleucine--tRNA ligase [Candidatus Odinarchaeota archaeon]|nr:isoleucine--tRNA ligase [Candidatus Odinarchaeota archaeon]